MKNFISIADWTQQPLWDLLSLAVELKAKQRRGEAHRLLPGKSLAMIFRRSSVLHFCPCIKVQGRDQDDRSRFGPQYSRSEADGAGVGLQQKPDLAFRKAAFRTDYGEGIFRRVYPGEAAEERF